MSKSRYSILIICEGDNTEPSFFNSIRDKIISGEFDLDAAIKILPEPKVNNEEKEEDNEHKSKRKKRDLRKAINNEPTEIKGAPPLKWVKAGIEELELGTYNEVWTVFDHDDHPKRKEAFELADSTTVDGRKVNIAFTSRSFEYFLLLNFENIFNSFRFTDCKVEAENINCGSGNHENDCSGKLCINGYARTNSYWENSKAKESTYPLIADRLHIGLDNSVWLRNKSDIIEKGVQIYDRNPYTDVDILISRLTGEKQRKWINFDSEIEGITILKINKKSFNLVNSNNRTLLLVKDSFFAVDISGNSKLSFGDRILLQPAQNVIVTIPDKICDFDYFGFSHNGKLLLFSLNEG